MKIQFTIITALILAVGCSSEEPSTQYLLDGYTPSSKAMAFDTHDSTSEMLATRGAMVDAFAEGDQMGVYAYYTAQGCEPSTTPNFMNNQLITKTNIDWVYSPVKFWSDNTDDSFVFQAYAPYSTSTNGVTPYSTQDGDIAIEYTMPTECAEQPDLMISAPLQITNENITFHLYHTLATVAFAVKGDSNQRITAIAVSGIVDRGIVAWSSSKGTPEWLDVSSSGSTYAATIDPNTTPEEGSSTIITTTQGYLMVIPQSIPEQGFDVTVELADAEMTTSSTKSLTILPTADVAEWVMNKNYTYIITLEE